MKCDECVRDYDLLYDYNWFCYECIHNPKWPGRLDYFKLKQKECPHCGEYECNCREQEYL